MSIMHMQTIRCTRIICMNYLGFLGLITLLLVVDGRLVPLAYIQLITLVTLHLLVLVTFPLIIFLRIVGIDHALLSIHLTLRGKLLLWHRLTRCGRLQH